MATSRGVTHDGAQDWLPLMIRRSLDQLGSEGVAGRQEEQAVLSLLAGRPSPAEVLALRPSPALRLRASELLIIGQTGRLSAQEKDELNRILRLEELVRLAQAYAAPQRTNAA